MNVIDDFLPDAHRVRRDALCGGWIDYQAHDGEVYKRVQMVDVPGLKEAIEKAEGRPVEIHAQGYRLNFNSELPNAAIHSDLGWGARAAVVYLSDGDSGTAFWRHKATGAERIDGDDPGLLAEVEIDLDRPGAWDQVACCKMKFNRAVLYDGLRFHSRWPFEAFGSSPEDGRLIAVAFYS